jgi:hypothetical protein
MRLVISALLSCAFECLILRKSSKVMHMAERQSAQLVIRVQPALRKELESVAAAERRPLGNLVRLALSDWLAQHSVETRPAA